MTPVLQTCLPDDQRAMAARPLPGMAPVVGGDWLTVDTTYDAQLAAKAALLRDRPDDVLACLPEARAAALEVLENVLTQLGSRDGFSVGPDTVVRPDGALVHIDRADPLRTVSMLIQEDICILQKQGDAHVLTAGLLCFPASWTLAEKIGRALPAIHKPVPSYDDNIAPRVQRLFDGAKVGRPMWRANLLRYVDPAFYHPRKEAHPRPADHEDGRYERSERQTVLRLPETDAVIFAIHTSVVRVE